MNETPASDPLSIWRNQRREHSAMSVEEIRMKASAVQLKVRRNLIIALVCGILFLLVGALSIAEFRHPSTRTAVAILIILTFSVAYRAWHRIWPAETLSPDAALNACVDFYRDNLKDQYRAVALTWRFLIPLSVLFWMAWSPLALPNGYVAHRILLPAALALILVARRWEASRIQRELNALEASVEREESQPLHPAMRPWILSVLVFAILFVVLLWLLPHMMNWILGTLRASHRTS